MARYYLNMVNGAGLVPDEEGQDFPDLRSARNKAVEGVRSLLADELKTGGLINLQGRIEIVDQHGSIVLVVPFRDAVEIRLDDFPAQEDP